MLGSRRPVIDGRVIAGVIIIIVRHMGHLIRVSQASRCGRNHGHGELHDAEHDLLLASPARRRRSTFVTTGIRDTAHDALSLISTGFEGRWAHFVSLQLYFANIQSPSGMP